MAIRTIFGMAEDCAKGERLGWQELVRNYAGIAASLVGQYFPTLVPELDSHVAAVFRRAATNHSAWFKNLNFRNEREFMMAFRDLVFAYGREQERLPTPQITLDQLRDAAKGVTVLERELLWLFIKGYTAEQIARIMMNAVATVESVKQFAEQHLTALVPSSTPNAFTASAGVLLESAEKLKSDQCVTLKTFGNFVNGQITWRDREVAEEHMANCFYCIDRFTTFQEMVRLRKDVQPWPAPQVDAMLARLGFVAAKPRRLISKLFASL